MVLWEFSRNKLGIKFMPLWLSVTKYFATIYYENKVKLKLLDKITSFLVESILTKNVMPLWLSVTKYFATIYYENKVKLTLLDKITSFLVESILTKIYFIACKFLKNNIVKYNNIDLLRYN